MGINPHWWAHAVAIVAVGVLGWKWLAAAEQVERQRSRRMFIDINGSQVLNLAGLASIEYVNSEPLGLRFKWQSGAEETVLFSDAARRSQAFGEIKAKLEVDQV